MRIELHCHSTCSDGSLPPEQVAQAAFDRQVELFCLTDHDSCAGFEAARDIFGDRAMRGVELSCHEAGRTVHLLLYDVANGAQWDVLEEALVQQAIARRQRLHAMAARLEQLGVAIDVDAIIEGASGRTVGRPDVARALLAAGHVRDLQEAFSRFIGDAKPADVPMQRVSVADALQLAKRAGAVVSLAHPHILGEAAQPMLRAHRANGLEGIEALYGPATQKQRKRWKAVAAQLDMVVTAGSDFHGDMMPRVTEVGVDLPGPFVAPLLNWLRR